MATCGTRVLALCVAALVLTALRQTAAGLEAQPDGSGSMFDSIAGSYDMLNKIISLGRDSAWRQDAIGAMQVDKFAARTTNMVRVLDVATGTADVAIAVAKTTPSHVLVNGIDPSPNMLELGQAKVSAAGLDERIALQVGVSESLPFDSATFDFVTVSFGVRNFQDRIRGLREISRVLKSHTEARLVILEVSEPKDGWLAPFARMFIHDVMPFIAGMISKRPKEYRYLQESLETFPDPVKFGQLLEAAGLSVVSHRRLPPFQAGPDLYVVRKSDLGTEGNGDQEVLAGKQDAHASEVRDAVHMEL